MSTTGDNLTKAQADLRRGGTLIGHAANTDDVTLGDFDLEAVLGEGTFGRVYLANLPATNKRYAIKAIRKDKLIDYDQVASTLLEQRILLEADHHFLCGM